MEIFPELTMLREFFFPIGTLLTNLLEENDEKIEGERERGKVLRMYRLIVCIDHQLVRSSMEQDFHSLVSLSLSISLDFQSTNDNTPYPQRNSTKKKPSILTMTFLLCLTRCCSKHSSIRLTGTCTEYRLINCLASLNH